MDKQQFPQRENPEQYYSAAAAPSAGNNDAEDKEEDSKLPARNMVYREENDHGESSSFVSQGQLLDEERIHPSAVDSSIRPPDVLCGRGKLSFNHGESIEVRRTSQRMLIVGDNQPPEVHTQGPMSLLKGHRCRPGLRE